MKTSIQQIILSVILLLSVTTAHAQWERVHRSVTPAYAFRGGNEADGSPLYIARIQHEGGVHIGKARQNAAEAFIPYGGAELIVDRYDVYVGKGKWVSGTNGKSPKGAVMGGYEADGSPLYIARAYIGGGWHIGKARRNATEAFIPYGGREEIVSDFQILVW
jgi:Protein of unknown function (DUF3421)